MKKILVIYFTQTGQAKQAIDAVLKPFSSSENYQIHYELICPEIPFSYPWKYTEFFDAFPENVKEIPCKLAPLKVDANGQYDLIFIAYQPWFLSICRPINSFLKSEEAKKLLKNKPVITIINCRNMWLGAQEKMKKHLRDLDAKLSGNIVFTDHASNLVSLVTVLAFELKGVKENYLGVFPKYGIDSKDLEQAVIAGSLIEKGLNEHSFDHLQPELVKLGLTDVRANLMIMEGRGQALFPLYAAFILKKGSSGTKARKVRVKIFGILLPAVILLFSPIITLIARLTPLFAARKIKKQIAYYQQNGSK